MGSGGFPCQMSMAVNESALVAVVFFVPTVIFVVLTNMFGLDPQYSKEVYSKSVQIVEKLRPFSRCFVNILTVYCQNF